MSTDLRPIPSPPLRAHRAARVAIVGSGIAGLAAARTLQGLADITLFEAGDHFGGHTHTVDVTLPDAQGLPTTFGVDTGFLVLNERAYPNLIALLTDLEVPMARSDMSFSVQVPGAGPGGDALEWSDSGLSSVFAQRRNMADPRFLRMLADILRFNRVTSGLATRGEDPRPDSVLWQPLREFLRAHRFSDAFRDWYLLPMLGGIWSCPTDQMLEFPVAAMLRFCHHHGLLQVKDRAQWHTVAGGARQYVSKIVAGIADKRLSTPVQQVLRDEEGVRVVTPGHVERFDAIVIACHSDQALRLLGAETSANEQAVLGAVHYQANRAVLHTDASVLPQNRRAWAARNCERAPSANAESAQVCLHYLINRLQPLPVAQPVIVSLNPLRDIVPTQVLGEYAYHHPVFDLDAIHAQTCLPAIQGKKHTWFAGAWTGNGFHEDGLKSGLQAARALIDALGLMPAVNPRQTMSAALPGVFA
ncbi:NAD(P)/FAD-dependent oxidoreductase [Hydrogenophaga sp. BPS33]|uniref:NAD(P)/FAD-dependent oxidoreductase n=1 Tax=Hydrogenophaga sp. BPS33 TaxID=2651974 RepID=UPI00131FAE38|nr:FAD-dependent oxidoreductase [Hydrogenophaga sp. BPS33]QHE88610.1 NAD(P)-binding protein [Hydrogenophaga sp. BPS33]